MPPSSERASPAEDTVISTLYPGLLKGGSVATTNTAAMFFTCILLALLDPV